MLLTSPDASRAMPSKPIIISIVASTPDELAKVVSHVQDLRQALRNEDSDDQDLSMLVAIEFNTSCPNIKDRPPPSYDFPTLTPLLDILAGSFRSDRTLTIGLKLPPYIYATQFTQLTQVLSSYTQHSDTEQELSSLNPFAFLTCTNTLGSSLLFSDQVLGLYKQDGLALSTEFGGLAGEAIHALSLGNVHAISKQLASNPDKSLHNIVLIGVGGVVSKGAVQRMHKAGAQIVGCATLLGRLGIRAFNTLITD